MTFREKLAKVIYPEIFSINEQLEFTIKVEENRLSVLEEDYDLLEQDFIVLEEQLKGLQTQLDVANEFISKQSPIDEYLSKHYTRVSNFAYQQKREYDEQPISVFVNEMITPNAFAIKQLQRRFSGDTVLELTKKYADHLAQRFTWTSDSNLATSGDYYLYPNEILANNKGDCEDHSFVLASLLPEHIGLAYGFYTNPRGQREAHAWNVMVNEDGRLFYAETTGRRGVVKVVSKMPTYDVYYFMTQEYTYVVKNGVQFGKIAGW